MHFESAALGKFEKRDHPIDYNRLADAIEKLPDLIENLSKLHRSKGSRQDIRASLGQVSGELLAATSVMLHKEDRAAIAQALNACNPRAIDVVLRVIPAMYETASEASEALEKSRPRVLKDSISHLDFQAGFLRMASSDGVSARLRILGGPERDSLNILTSSSLPRLEVLAKEDPLLSFIVDLRAGLDRAAKLELYDYFKNKYKDFFKALRDVRSLLDCSDPEVALATLREIYSKAHEISPFASIPGGDLFKGKDQNTTLEQLKRFINPRHDGSINSFVYTYMRTIEGKTE